VIGCEILYYNWWRIKSNGSKSTTDFGLNVENITENNECLYQLDFDTGNKKAGK
jgi:hypothetical protein